MSISHRQLGLEETEEEVRARRGTPLQTLERIRTTYHLPDHMQDARIFWYACQNYYGTAYANENAAEHYACFLATNALPQYVLRCGDPDVFYPNMTGLV